MHSDPPKAHIRPLAAQDLEQIVRFLDDHFASDAADRFLEEFYRAFQMLAEMPQRH